MSAFHNTLVLARRTALSAASMALLGLGLASASALAATPETPITGAPTSVTASTATLNGELNPGSSSQALYYRFAYTPGPSCANAFGEGQFNLPGSPAEISGAHDEVVVTAEGLTPNTEYTVCLMAGASEFSFSFGDELAFGPPVTFQTLPAPPALGAEKATVTLAEVTLEAEVNPNNEPTSYTFYYSKTEAAGALTGQITEVKSSSSLEGTGAQVASAGLGSLLPGTTYYYQVIAENAQSRIESKPVAGPVQQFTTLPPPPTATTGAVLGVAQTSVLVTGTINPEGLASTYEYQYGQSTAYEQSTTTLPLADASGEVAAPGTLTDLTPGTLYHYRLLATSDDGTSYGEDRTFTTPAGVLPGALTGAANVTSPNTATITGTLDTQGMPTSYGFQIGTEAGSYGPATGLGSVGAGADEANVSLALQNLQPATTYHYRLLASNRDGTQNGADQAFTTPAVSSALAQPAAAPLIAAPTIAFPTTTTDTSTTKTLTDTQKLAKALKACAKKPKRQRANCEKQARKKYALPRKRAKK
jgi:hypothetical protein